MSAVDKPKIISRWTFTNPGPVDLLNGGSQGKSTVQYTQQVMRNAIQANVAQTVNQYLGSIWVSSTKQDGGHWRVASKDHGLAFDPELTPYFIEEPYKTLKIALGIQFPAEMGNERTIAFSLEDGTRVTVSLNVEIARTKESQAILYLQESSLKVKVLSKEVSSTAFGTSISNKKFEYDVSVVPGTVEDNGKIARQNILYMSAGTLESSSENKSLGPLQQQPRAELIAALQGTENQTLADKVPTKTSSADSTFAGEVVIILRGTLYLPVSQLTESTVEGLTQNNLSRMDSGDWKALIMLRTREQFGEYLRKLIPRGINTEIHKSSSKQNYFNTDPKNPYRRDFQVLLKVGDLPIQTAFTINMLAEQTTKNGIDNTHFQAEFVTFLDKTIGSTMAKKKQVDKRVLLGFSNDHAQWILKRADGSTEQYAVNTEDADAAQAFAAEVNQVIGNDVSGSILKNHLLHYTIQAGSILPGYKLNLTPTGGVTALAPTTVNLDDATATEIAEAF